MERAGREENADKGAEWSGAESEGAVTEGEAMTAGGQGRKERRGRQRRGGCRKMERGGYLGTQWPAGATPVMNPLRPLTRREWVAAIGRGWKTGGGLEAGGTTRTANPWDCRATTGAALPPKWPTSPPELGTRRGVARPPEWQKTHEGPAREWEGESSHHRASTPPEWQSYPGATKPLE